MIAAFARARARGSQVGLTTHVHWEKWGRPALVKGDRCATESARILSCAERGTGLDQHECEFSSAASSNQRADWWRYPLWLSAFPYGFEAFRPAIGGVQDSEQNETFWGQRVPFRPIHFYLFGACEAWPGCRLTWRGRRTTNLKNLTNEGREHDTIPGSGFDRDYRSDDRVVVSSARFAPRTLNWEEGEDLLFCAIISYHFGPRERRCWIDRSRFRMDTCGSPGTRIWGVERSAGRAAAILGRSDAARGRGFGFEFGRWFAITTDRVHSRNPCGVRTRDESTKRTRQESGRRTEGGGKGVPKVGCGCASTTRE